jgi:hypothetical protein
MRRPRFPFSWLAPALRHFGVEFEQLFEPLGIVFEPPPDIDALQHLVVALMRFSQIGGHLLRVIEVGDGRREMCLARQQNVLRATGQVGLVLLGQRRDGKRVPANRCFKSKCPPSVGELPRDISGMEDMGFRNGSTKIFGPGMRYGFIFSTNFTVEIPSLSTV